RPECTGCIVRRAAGAAGGAVPDRSGVRGAGWRACPPGRVLGRGGGTWPRGASTRCPRSARASGRAWSAFLPTGGCSPCRRSPTRACPTGLPRRCQNVRTHRRAHRHRVHGHQRVQPERPDARRRRVLRARLALLNAPSGRVRWSNGSFADATSLGFSPDGRRIVAGSLDGTIAVFDAASGHLIAGPRVAHPGWVDAATFAPGGRIILSAGTDGTVRLWNAADLRPVGEPLRVSDN